MRAFLQIVKHVGIKVSGYCWGVPISRDVVLLELHNKGLSPAAPSIPESKAHDSSVRLQKCMPYARGWGN